MSNKSRNLGAKYSASNHNSNTKSIVKSGQEIVEVEKKLRFRRAKMRAMCTHSDGVAKPALSYREDKNGGIVWICRHCGEVVDLHRISDEDLTKAINTVSQACNLIKIMSDPTYDRERNMLDVISNLQLNCNTYVDQLYHAALNSSNKRKQKKHDGGAKSVIWES